MEPTHDVPPGGAPLSTSFRPSMRPIVPMRVTEGTRPKEPVKKDNPANPFAMIQAANRDSEQLGDRLQLLAEKLAGPSLKFDPADRTEVQGLMPLAGEVARLIGERSRHGISLIDKIEEHLA
jgi:hypothetical protein